MTKTHLNTTTWQRFINLGEAIDAAFHRDPVGQLNASLHNISRKVERLEAERERAGNDRFSGEDVS